MVARHSSPHAAVTPRDHGRLRDESLLDDPDGEADADYLDLSERDLCPLPFQFDGHVGGIAVNLNRNIVETRFSPTVEGMPKATWLLGAKNAHVQHAVIVLIFKRAQRPSALGNLELKAGGRTRLNAHLLDRVLQEALRIPEGHIDCVFSRAPTHFSREMDAFTPTASGKDDERRGKRQTNSQKKSLVHLIHS